MKLKDIDKAVCFGGLALSMVVGWTFGFIMGIEFARRLFFNE